MSVIINEWIAYMREIFASISAHWISKGALSAMGTTAGYLFGVDNYTVLTALLFLIVIEFATGILAAYKNNEPILTHFSSTAALKFVVYGLFVAASNLTENIVPGNTFIDDGTISFLALTELIKVVENTGKMGFAVPMKLLNRIQSIRDGEVAVK